MSDYYLQPLSRISQGDIIDVAPHAFVSVNTKVLEEQDGGGICVCDFREGHNGRIVVESKSARAILLSNDCTVIDKSEYPKANIRAWQVCPVVPLTTVEKGLQGAIKKNKVFRYLYLPANGALLPESFVDFTFITSLAPEYVRRANRVFTLSDSGRQVLYNQFIRFVTKWELVSIACPSCGVEFDPTLSLELRSE